MTDTITKKISVLALDGAVILLCLLAKPIINGMRAVIPPCVFYENGFVCPACGGTRSMEALFRGDISAAFGYHPYMLCLAFLAVAGLVVANLANVFDRAWAKRLGQAVFRGRSVIILAVGYAVFGIMRMLLHL